ncbi:hypothetical protein BpHYR1_008038, partial [Brachionus plicatilis]
KSTCQIGTVILRELSRKKTQNILNFLLIGANCILSMTSGITQDVRFSTAASISINLQFEEKKYNLIIRKNDNLVQIKKYKSYVLQWKLKKYFEVIQLIESKNNETITKKTLLGVAMSCLNDLFLEFIRGGVVIPNPYVNLDKQYVLLEINFFAQDLDRK